VRNLSKVFKAKENINTLKKQTEIIKSNEYKAFQIEIGELTSKIAEFKSYRTDYEKLIVQIDSLTSTIDQLHWSDVQAKEILVSLRQTLISHKDQLQSNFTKSNTDYIKEDFPSQLNNLEKDLSEYLKARGLSPENVQELTQANTKIKEYEEEIRLAHIDKKPFDQVYSLKTKTIESYKDTYESYKSRFRSVTVSLQERLAGLSMTEKEITFVLEIDFSELKNNLVEFIKENLEDDTSLRSDAIERLLFEGADISNLVKNKNLIRDHLSQSTKAEKHRLIIQELINDDVFLEKYHLRMLKYFFDVSNIHVQTKLGGKLLKNTSFGERCGIVIAIVLVAGTNPIVIDQPEDHLDGRFISDVLVPLLRQQKHNRQIILITRDANIVVGGDAELIHILEPTDQRTEILPASIEDIDLREKYIWILDGGADAFSRRDQKYDIELLRSHNSSNS
jgi:soluble cytochrome b562